MYLFRLSLGIFFVNCSNERIVQAIGSMSGSVFFVEMRYMTNGTAFETHDEVTASETNDVHHKIIKSRRQVLKNTLKIMRIFFSISLMNRYYICTPHVYFLNEICVNPKCFQNNTKKIKRTKKSSFLFTFLYSLQFVSSQFN